MLFAVSVTTKRTSTPSRFTVPFSTMPPMRNRRPCGASLATTWDGVKKNTRFFSKAERTSVAAMPRATTPSAMAARRLCRGFIAAFYSLFEITLSSWRSSTMSTTDRKTSSGTLVVPRIQATSTAGWTFSFSARESMPPTMPAARSSARSWTRSPTGVGLPDGQLPALDQPLLRSAHDGDEAQRVELVEPVVDLARRVRLQRGVDLVLAADRADQLEDLAVVRREAGAAARPCLGSCLGETVGAPHGRTCSPVVRRRTRQFLAFIGKAAASGGAAARSRLRAARRSPHRKPTHRRRCSCAFSDDAA